MYYGLLVHQSTWMSVRQTPWPPGLSSICGLGPPLRDCKLSSFKISEKR